MARIADFTKNTIRVLRERVGGLCSNPSCRVHTTGPHTEPHRVVRLGAAAHITAASPGGARYDESLSMDQRRGAGNGIWLCEACAKLIDADEQRYSVDLLRGWKETAERQALHRLESNRPDYSRDSRHDELPKKRACNLDRFTNLLWWRVRLRPIVQWPNHATPPDDLWLIEDVREDEKSIVLSNIRNDHHLVLAFGVVEQVIPDYNQLRDGLKYGFLKLNMEIRFDGSRFSFDCL